MEVLFGLDPAEQERAAALRARGQFFWLDIVRDEASRDDLAETLGIGDGALRALSDLGDSPRTFHADGDVVVFAFRCYLERPIDVHVVVTGEYLLTLHEEDVSLPVVLGSQLPADRGRDYAVYSVLDSMLATTFRALDEVELALDEVAASWTDEGGGQVPRATLRECGSTLATMRRWVGAEQTIFERVAVEIGALSGFDGANAPYFDRLDRQLDRLVASVDAAASAMGTLLDLELNERAYVVSVVATIFVPLTFITGFFGMNFEWMVDQVSSPVAFWLLGFAIPVVTGLLMWRLLVRRFLIGQPRQVSGGAP